MAHDIHAQPSHTNNAFEPPPEHLADVGITLAQWQALQERDDWLIALGELAADAEREREDREQAERLQAWLENRDRRDGCSEVACWLLAVMALAGALARAWAGWI